VTSTQAGQKSKEQGKPNRLINETSTYLLQHAYNPVDWYPWGPEALERARQEDKPILLSIGYSACHWCHVMEHESFENEETALLMNEKFINIKVDREERTDLDEIYMKAVQMMTGHGGWPMTVFLTPELKPFYGGTYFPPVDRHGLPGFQRLLAALSLTFKEKREEVDASSEDITEHLRMLDNIGTTLGEASIDHSLIDQALDKLIQHFDDRWGGFGSAPKFPHSFSIDLAMRCSSKSYKGDQRSDDCEEVVRTTLDRMAYGGIHDQIGGGFARYSVDGQWLIPHFEKMLYDNALLCQTYLNGYVAFKRPYWATVARGIMDFVLRELRTEQGGFFSSLDADSEGEEGKFYVWTHDEILDTLGREDGNFFCTVFGVTERGNFEHGCSALYWVRSPEETAEQFGVSVEELWTRLEVLKEKLMVERSARVRPGRDEKVLTSWNSLMISALVDGYRILKDEKYLRAAKDAANFILKELTAKDKLLRTWGQGRAKLDGYLDDYAFFSQALLDLAAVDFESKWIERAMHFTKEMLALFWDDAAGDLYYTSKDHEALVTRPRSQYDGSIPSGTSVATFVLVRLSRLTADPLWEKRAKQLMKKCAPLVVRVPDQFANLLGAMDYWLTPSTEVVILGSQSAQENAEMVFASAINYAPNKTVLCWPEKQPADAQPELKNLLTGRTLLQEKPTAYLCHNFACDKPTSKPAELAARIENV
jgi:hypothetical protein